MPRLTHPTARTALSRVLLLALAADLALPALAGGGHEGCLEGRTLFVPAAKSAAFDEDSGRDLRNFPPHRLADLTHMRLEILIEDMNTPRFTATQSLRLAALGQPLETLTLDARGLSIASVAMAGRETRFSHDGRALTVTFAPALQPGEIGELITEYSANDPALGLIWTPESPAFPGRPAQLHTQGQPETNSFWFPCRDFPNERLTTELLVTVPAGYTVSGNGYLADRRREIRTAKTAAGDQRMRPYDTFHWVQDKPHVPYLVSLVVGKFDVVDVGSKQLSMPVYVPPGQGPWVQGTYGRTRDMVTFFERVTGQPYPWARYAQLVVWNFGAGGMENTSATTLYDTAVFRPDALIDHDLDGLISHELAHQWFGDLATCNSWEHIWLNEGFATYMTDLWFEHRDGRDRYEAEMIGQFDGVIGADKAEAPAAQGMASKVYTHPWEVFRRPANPYGKGASVLHMLRRELGDEQFFAGVRLYTQRYALKTTETSDLRYALEEVSGRSLEQFFTQWCTRPGVPLLTVTPAWDAASSTLTVTVEQTQPINGDNPAFEFDLPIAISTGSAALQQHEAAVTGRTATWSTKLDQEPVFIAVDPDMHVLAGITIKQEEPALLRQIANGPTLYSRVQACRTLSSQSGPVSMQAAAALSRVVHDRALHYRLRQEAVRALVARGAHADVRSLATTATDHWEVRVTTTEALAQVANSDPLKDNSRARDAIGAQLAERAAKDKSTKVRAAAIRALADAKTSHTLPAVLAALRVESQSDAIRQAALDALAKLDAPDTIQHAIAYSMPGNDSRTRPTAVAAMAKLARQNKDLAIRTLTDLLHDRQLRTQRAAGDALAEIDDPRAAEALRSAAEAPRSEEHRAMYSEWLEKIDAKSNGG
ncbi:MAG TPA: M1 family aminopeptidase [Phycisphaerales bacterium]|nr:M1 family aminopeptidase [Phycisphaerales bacterium]